MPFDLLRINKLREGSLANADEYAAGATKLLGVPGPGKSNTSPMPGMMLKPNDSYCLSNTASRWMQSFWRSTSLMPVARITRSATMQWPFAKMTR